MNLPIRYLLSVLLGLLWLQPLRAQQDTTVLITLALENHRLGDVLEEIRRQYPVQIFYRADDLPPERRAVNVVRMPVDDLLRDILEGSKLDFIAYRNYAYIIGSRDIIGTEFSADYYRALDQALSGGSQAEGQLQVGSVGQLDGQGYARLQGQLLDAVTGEAIAGATIFVSDQQAGTASDAAGKFELRLPPGQHQLAIQYIGYESLERQISVRGSGDIAFELRPGATNLEEVVVRTRAADANVAAAQVGVSRLDLATIERSPAVLGEVDVVRSLLLNPGVSTIGEGSAGFNVRGGEIDQNLLLQDEVVLFNASHALGFFSTFNADLLRSVDLYKGNLPARYGGRLASVLNVEMRDGNFDRHRLKAGIGPVSGKVMLEGPVLRETSSFILGVRSSYADWVFGLFNKLPQVQRSGAFFLDANLRYTHRINPQHSLTLSAYYSDDQFDYNDEYGFDYGTRAGQLTYNWILKEGWFSNLSLVGSTYHSRQSNFTGEAAAELNTGVRYLKLKEQISFERSQTLQWDMGAEGIIYYTNPGQRVPLGEGSLLPAVTLAEERALEAGLFVNADWTVSPRLSLTGGLRLANYRFLGPGAIYAYNGEIPRPGEVVDTLTYAAGQLIAAYGSVEPRLSARYRLSATTSIKGGYSRTAQFINQIFNSDTPTPTSQYQLSSRYIPPFRAHNYSLGYFRNFRENDWETSAELYYRSLDQLWDYIDFAELVVNDQLETEIRSGRGRAYGLELSAKKQRGILNGWLSYTLSRSERQIAAINRGGWYPSNFDKPHNLSLILNYQPDQRNTVSLNFTYSTGRPTTAPIASYRDASGLIVPIYSARNQVRIPDYHRLDLSYTVGKGYDQTKKFHTSWTFSIYNLYGRKNAFSVFYQQSPGQRSIARQLSVLGTVFPALTINIETL